MVTLSRKPASRLARIGSTLVAPADALAADPVAVDHGDEPRDEGAVPDQVGHRLIGLGRHRSRAGCGRRDRAVRRRLRCPRSRRSSRSLPRPPRSPGRPGRRRTASRRGSRSPGRPSRTGPPAPTGCRPAARRRCGGRARRARPPPRRSRPRARPRRPRAGSAASSRTGVARPRRRRDRHPGATPTMIRGALRERERERRTGCDRLERCERAGRGREPGSTPRRRLRRAAASTSNDTSTNRRSSAMHSALR